MNALVVYDSQFGNTERIALAIASASHAFGQAQAVRVDPAHTVELQGVDVLIMGCPTQGWRPTRAMQSFLDSLATGDLHDKSIACFDTRFRKPRWLTGSAASVMAKRLQKRGIELLAPPESFFVIGKEGPLYSGEVERAATWATMLLKRIEIPHPAVQQ